MSRKVPRISRRDSWEGARSGSEHQKVSHHSTGGQDRSHVVVATVVWNDDGGRFIAAAWGDSGQQIG